MVQFEFLKVNCNKTKFILFNSNSNSLRLPIRIFVSGVHVDPSLVVRYLGVTLDPSFSFEPHVMEICKSSFAFLRSLYRIRSNLPLSCVLSLINAFVFSRLDYCNSVLSFCNQRTIGRLQRVQNSLIRLVKFLPRRSPTSDAIRNIGWLRVKDRISYKIFCIVHKCLYGSAPSYVNELIFLSQSSVTVSLRSESSPTLYIPITYAAFVRKAFFSLAPRLWNSLSVYQRSERYYHVFKRRLKAYLL